MKDLERHKEKIKEWKKNNPEKIKAHQRKWYLIIKERKKDPSYQEAKVQERIAYILSLFEK